MHIFMYKAFGMGSKLDTVASDISHLLNDVSQKPVNTVLIFNIH